MWFIYANKHLDGASIGCLHRKYQTVLISRKQLAQACKQNPPLSKCLCKHSVCTKCLHKQFDSGGCVCVLAQTTCVKSKQFYIFYASSQCLRRLSACFHKHTSVLLGVDTVWLCQLSLFVVKLTTLCLPKGLPKNDSF